MNNDDCSGDRTDERWFEEYRELSLSWRADDERLSKLTTVLVPISFAAFALNNLLSMFGGLLLMIYWSLAAHITVKKNLIYAAIVCAKLKRNWVLMPISNILSVVIKSVC